MIRFGAMRRGSPARRHPVPMTEIARGTLLYHGTSAEEEFEPDAPDGPAWFSTSMEVARRFVGWNNGEGLKRVLVYRASCRIQKVALLRSSEDMSRFLARLEGHDDPDEVQADGTEEMRDLLGGQSAYAGWRIPDNYGFGKDDVLLVDPAECLEFVRVDRP